MTANDQASGRNHKPLEAALSRIRKQLPDLRIPGAQGGMRSPIFRQDVFWFTTALWEILRSIGCLMLLRARPELVSTELLRLLVSHPEWRGEAALGPPSAASPSGQV